MTPQSLIWQASLAKIDLNVRDGDLYARPIGGSAPTILLAAMKARKPAIAQILTVWPHIASLREDALARCRPLTPEALTDDERFEAERLTADLVEAGGLGQFMIDVMHPWNDLTERERLQTAWCWECAAAQVNVVAAA